MGWVFGVEGESDSYLSLTLLKGEGGERSEANARLIAAAPDLLNELREARITVSILRTQIMVEIGRCADPRDSRWQGVPEKLKERLDAIDAAIAKALGQDAEGVS